MPAFAKPLSEHIARLVVPALSDAGFAFDGSRTFRRFPGGKRRAQIVNFQLGERFMAGKFTVNLAVYDPDDAAAQVDPEKALEYHCSARLRQRLGLLLPARLGALARFPGLGMFFRQRDGWWRADDPKSVKNARDAIFARGLAWLDANTAPT